MTDTTIGIDISKAHLDVATHPKGNAMQFTNNKKGHKALLRWIRTVDMKLIVFEPTGAYHRSLEQFLGMRNLPYVKVNPLHAKRFGEAMGKLVKTDVVDAKMLAFYGATLVPNPSSGKSQALVNLHELMVARKALIKDKTAAANRQHIQTISLLKRQLVKRLKQIDADITAIDRACREITNRDLVLKRRFEILKSIPGLGDITIFTLLAEMPELGSMDKRQAGALAGLAPVTRQSGNWKGQSFIQGGRADVRKALYMPALVATRFNPVLKAKYQAMMEAHKPFKIVITAIMRKLITIANALLRDNRKWNETPC
ncbi:MAG TPA: IS110 family transposase [Hellea balneolensis]|uniref:IS110 family transposase n=1 Tax=Hellea balneolensis TaxID=287478 RepID=A0A7C3GCL1_9PROT|nr:IS110 family transposase [Hellea balneolensis]